MNIGPAVLSRSTPPVALTIAGSDSGGCAGIQADLKTFSALGVFGASAITAITAQNTQGVTAVQTLEPVIVAQQIQAVQDDFTLAACKTGMLASAEIIDAVAQQLKRSPAPLIIDPVMISTSGHRLISEEAIDAVINLLFPLALLITPNLHEASVMTGLPVPETADDMLPLAEALLTLGAKAVLLKGGHLQQGMPATDWLVTSDYHHQFTLARVETRNTHGTGCSLSAAITAGLAQQFSLLESVGRAKDWLHQALTSAASWQLGQGAGPVNHFHQWWGAHHNPLEV
ncbi:bifunctional hydroxymethylpyrimidine kinase/phosphomethylpyrimidine kinase [Pokkaliibacter sp. CJK22405]|uniref:bifunctional hydroxymethylpyrimidine kinase/phosphomethylpyrimidine kinase n=1 Tax=Pokkaliibacter sp. CJK22405 TaxID=3384615 RepID=UPI003985197C